MVSQFGPVAQQGIRVTQLLSLSFLRTSAQMPQSMSLRLSTDCLFAPLRRFCQHARHAALYSVAFAFLDCLDATVSEHVCGIAVLQVQWQDMYIACFLFLSGVMLYLVSLCMDVAVCDEGFVNKRCS
eukprot:TRINITY_DN17233_c0_g1_i1.p4 TRINITY_DN17233_c0_g1~~TRINITY_DN17233_c0_g1_i1.p4  ORF type:complete len:127 (+),score=3.22 TRINITY_DN17233_c0_g1_i1:121-501(+)